MSPRDGGGGPTHGTAANQTSHPHHKVSVTADSSALPCRFRCCGATFRDGFAHGFRDGLRIAARRLPPDMRPVLEAIADDYDLSSGDG